MRGMVRNIIDRSSLLRAVAVTAALLAAAMAGRAAAPVTADPPAGARQTRPQKIAELTADLGYGGDLMHVDAAIPYLAKAAVPDDPAWNPGNPQWPAVCALIGRNLHADATDMFAESEAVIAAGARHALEASVNDETLDDALAFFRSTMGSAYRELQNSLAELTFDPGVGSTTSTDEPAAEQVDARKRLLRVWLPMAFLRVIYPTQSADRVETATYDRLSDRHGPQLDALAQRYAAALPQFETFIKSTAFGAIIAAEMRAGQTTPPPNLPAFFAAESKKHAAEWRAAAAAH
jgi:hypothetical protein